ncbi:MAG: 4Fe-4S dicluster domain-containing protein [Euryarchaeota archaeon]|nr:4Fe-4S dicluster domain-containing protein [Euryarchaeota archaeon]MBT4982820.1 4Fe-4S dicluster domain-containing protein [Euryarchaeota archaeon]MBT5183659.1 4Fe-4S dicluster domain-containing protein [Euryarchaeota archaeon]
MGLIENLGAVASSYMDEKENLQTTDERRVRTMAGHGFWPHEVLRDTLIFGFLAAVLLFYAWLIPPPLHSAADPFAQAGFVFPDWYVLFSYGYLRWGEYLPQFSVPLGPVGEFFGQPSFPWNAAWWGAFLTGIPVGILALPPFLGGREKRPVEDPWFASAGVVYLAHIWFISVFSINIFLELYGKNRSDFCKLDSHGDLVCGARAPWIADLFNAIPWIMTGILLWIVIYFVAKWLFNNAWGAKFTPAHGKKLIVGAFIVATAASVVSYPVYDNGFWDAKGLLTIEDYGELEDMRSQPLDVHVHEHNEHMTDQGFEGDIVPASAWMQWNIYQPARYYLIDFADSNGHQNLDTGVNGASGLETYSGDETAGESGYFNISNNHWPENVEFTTVPVDATCATRASEVIIDGGVPTSAMMQSSLIITDHKTGEVVIDTDCSTGETGVELGAGLYHYEFRAYSTDALAANESVTVETQFTIKAYQPLLLYGEDAGNGLAGHAVNLSNSLDIELEGDEMGVVVNPTYHANPKALDAKLTYAMFIPCLTAGAVVFILLRNMARGYEFEMNKCYGCDLCDDACPVRLFNAGDKLNIIYNSWNNEDDGVPMYSCLTCTACTNACPQLVDYDSYVDIRRSLIVGGPAAEIPHTVLQAVLAAEAEEESDADFVPVKEYPIDSNIGYYPGCVDYLDQEMVFSHLNEGDMNLGDSTNSAFTLFEEMGAEVSYLGRDFLKCCGHDQKWQGLDEVFDKLKSYNQKKIEASGIDTLVSSCAECFRTFARDYELEGVKVMHTTEFLIENGFDMEMKVEDELTVTYHDPCRLGRQMGIYDEPRDLVNSVEGVKLVEMEHSGEDAMCCGVSSMMSCNENARSLRVSRMEEIRNTGADMMITSCPKCVSHFECLKFEDDEKYDIEILDVVSFLARQVEAKKQVHSEPVSTHVPAEA